MHYFDHCATTPPYDEVIAAVTTAMKSYYGNPSSIHKIGMEAERLLQRAREQMATLLGVDKEEIVFTSGGTESNNLALLGAAFQYRSRGNHIITSAVEHPSVYACCQRLEQMGYEVSYIQPNRDGIVSAEEVIAAVRPETILVSMMHVNNEMGAIQPIEAIGAKLRDMPRVLFHTDAVQSAGKLRLLPKQWGVDLLTISAHKFRGPKGAGMLYRRKGIELQPLLLGGGQETELRSGTENVPAIVGMAKAFRMAVERQADTAQHLHRLRNRLLEQLRAIPGAVMNGLDAHLHGLAAPHIVNVSFPGLRAEVIVHALEQHHICVSTKSACSSGEQQEPSRVLLAMGADRERASSGIRISLAYDHTEQDIDLLGRTMAQTIDQLRRLR